MQCYRILFRHVAMFTSVCGVSLSLGLKVAMFFFGGGGRGPIGFEASWRFKLLDSQLTTSNVNPITIDVHDLSQFQMF